MQVKATSGMIRSAGFAPVIFVMTLFLSASLLFFVQPLFTKIVLPQIGGSPAVWTTAMLFFQTVLIAGYLYAHLLSRALPVRGQVFAHLGIWALALFFLPLAVPEGWQFDPAGSAAWQTLAIFALGVGLPFFALSANAPLIQFWYSRSGGPSAEDPYFLYGASNLGSLVALLGFPLAAEPLFGAGSIGYGWAAGFVALGACLLLSGFCSQGPAAPRGRALDAAGRPALKTLAWWAFLAFVPSSLMLSVTLKISIDMGSFPLVWAVPLALYLMSFVVAFSNRRFVSAPALAIVAGASLAVMMLYFFGLHGRYLTWSAVGILLVCFFVLAVLAHRKLYEARPDGAHLTTFYLTMSVGGALGGLFNSLIAPVVFDGLHEAAITGILAALVFIRFEKPLRESLGLLLRGAIIGALISLPVFLAGSEFVSGDWTLALNALFMGACIAVALLRRSALALYGAGVVLILTGTWHVPDQSLLRDRSFFGTHVVAEEFGLRLYGNGTTIHGAQRVADDGASRPEPLYYYHRNGPMAQVLTSERAAEAKSIGIVGLGVGSLACYSQPGQDWHFYEIDRMVDRIARTTEHFRFLSACTPDAPTHLGDARVVLAGQTDMRFDILVIDAYSSDSVPVHLTTNDAIRLYMDRLAPGGILVFHISNRYYDIDRPLGRSAADLGLVARIQNYAGHVEDDKGDTPSTAVTLTRDVGDLGALADDPRWQLLESDGGRVWTDDFANLLSIMR